MFKELFALTERAPVLLLVAREGDDKLRVNLTRKQDEDEKEVPLSLSILATPAELDNELPLALAEGLALGEQEAKPVSVTDQVKVQVEGAKSEKTETTKPAARKKSKARKPVTPRVVKMKDEPKKKAAAAPKSPAKPKSAKAAKVKTAKGAQTPSAALAAVIGPDAITYNAAITKVWDYIRANNLQDSKNKRRITADDKLNALAGGKKLAVETIGAIVKGNLGPAAALTEAPVPEPVSVPAITPLRPDLSVPSASAPISEEVRGVAAGLDKPAEQVQADIAAALTPTAAAPREAAGAGDLDLFNS